MNPERIIKSALPVFVLAIVSRSIEEISFIYYLVPVMCLFFIVLFFISSKSNVRSHHKQENRGTDIRHPRPLRLSANLPRQAVSGIRYLVFIIPGLWFLLTSLWSSYPEISAVRALYYILISLGCISAGILWIRYSEKNIFDFFLPANVIVVLLCLFSLLTGIPSDSWTAGHGKGFMGFFGHQNLLASVLLFTLPAVLYQAVILAKSRIPIFFAYQRGEQHQESDSEQVGMTMRSGMTNNDIRHLESSIAVLIAYFLLLTANLLLLTLTYSRSAILSLIFGVIVFLILNKNWKVILYGISTAILLLIVIKFTPPLNQFTDTIIKKDFPEVYSSRMWMWEPSYRAALEGGVFGLGYGISHPDIRSGEYSDRFENGRIIREKGNSSLALVEETGLIGLVLFLLPIIYLLAKFRDTGPCLPAGRYQIPDKDYKTGIRNPASPSSLHFAGASSILIASLVAFILHAQFEAWGVGVGSVQLPLFFVFLGLAAHRLSSPDINT